MLGRLRTVLSGSVRPSKGHSVGRYVRQKHSFSEEAIECYRTGGYHPVRIDDYLSDRRYKIINKLGYGQYATVWLAFDNLKEENVALKILTADSYGGNKDTFELEVLRVINNGSSQAGGRSHVLGSLDHFKHRGPYGEHVCIVFEAMGPDMAALRKEFPKSQVPIPMLRQISRHLLLALTYLHDSCKIIHTDIKPSNILITTSSLEDMFLHAPPCLLVHSSRKLNEPLDFYMKSEKITADEDDIAYVPGFSVRLADFGTASFFDRHLTECIQPVMLRAPEVLLGAEWNWTADIWNLGLVLWELAEGKVLFDGCAVADGPYSIAAHLAQIEIVLGPMPESLLARSAHCKDFYTSTGTLKSKPQLRSGSLESFTQRSNLTGRDKSEFLDFIGSMLRLAPEKRLAAAELLSMPWALEKSE